VKNETPDKPCEGIIRGLLVGNLVACPMSKDKLPVKQLFKKEEIKLKAVP
jgi:hypothetical protein